MADEDLRNALQGLVELIARKDPDAWRKLADLVGCRLRNLFIRMGSPPEDAEDLACSCVLKSVTKINSYKPEKGSFKNWIFAIAMHSFFDERRKHPQTEPLKDYLTSLAQAEPCDIEQLELLTTAIEEALEKISVKERAIVRLAHRDGGSRRECIGQELGLSAGAVRVFLSRAQKKLVKLLAADPRVKPFLR